jgi:hypothetical protein
MYNFHTKFIITTNVVNKCYDCKHKVFNLCLIYFHYKKIMDLQLVFASIF